MKILKKISVLLLGAAGLIASSPIADAQSITDLLGGLAGSGSDSGNTIVNAIQGVFSKSDITIADIAGEWKSTGPAVAFKSDNLLKKAGGIAGAAALESKLSPYYKQYGLNDMTMSIDRNGNFKMTLKKVTLQGVMTANKGEGTFDFSIKALGAIPLGSFTAYVTTTGQTTNIMFDATKMKQLLSAVAKFTGNSLAKAAGSILDSYDGACIGFKLTKTGSAAGSSDTDSDSTTKTSGLENLLNIFGN